MHHLLPKYLSNINASFHFPWHNPSLTFTTTTTSYLSGLPTFPWTSPNPLFPLANVQWLLRPNMVGPPNTSVLSAHTVLSCIFSAAATLPCFQSLLPVMLPLPQGLSTAYSLSLHSSLIIKTASLNYLSHKIPLSCSHSTFLHSTPHRCDSIVLYVSNNMLLCDLCL